MLTELFDDTPSRTHHALLRTLCVLKCSPAYWQGILRMPHSKPLFAVKVCVFGTTKSSRALEFAVGKRSKIGHKLGWEMLLDRSQSVQRCWVLVLCPQSVILISRHFMLSRGVSFAAKFKFAFQASEKCA